MNVRPKIHLSLVQVSFFNSSFLLCIPFKGLISPTRIAIHSRMSCFLFSVFLLSSLYPASPHRFHSLRRLLFSIRPLPSARIRKGRRKVLFSRRGVFHFYPLVLPSRRFHPPLATLRFFACRLNFTSAYSRKFATTRKRKGKSQMEISYAIP